jgi:hypothetical protein
MDNKRQQKTKIHKEHSPQLVLPLPCALACLTTSSSSLIVCRSLASRSSISLYLAPAALSRANCSPRSLSLTSSNCQGPPFLGDIEEGEERGGGGGVWTTTEAGMKRTTGREENQVFKSLQGRYLNHTIFVRAEVRFVFYFL